MRGFEVKTGLVAALLLGIAACATGVTNPSTAGGTTGDTGGGGQGGNGAGAGGAGGEAGSGGGQGGESSSSSTSSTSSGSTSSGGMKLCGNGVKDPGEYCDGNDFGGKTCVDLGLGSGTLWCNPTCGINTSNCFPKESCNDYADNDEDGFVDCSDNECFGEPNCLDSCISPQILFVPASSNGDTTGRPDTVAASCSPITGPEAVFRIDSPLTGPVTIQVNSWSGADLSVSLRTTCADNSSELLCINDIGPGNFGTEILHTDIVAGQTYFIVVDGADGTSGGFDIFVDVPKPEQWCSDFFDDDADGYLDCDDATACQSTFECMPGAAAVGEQCFANWECMANANDPICLISKQGFPDGYCSEWCDLNINDCPGDGVCANIGLPSVNGVCLDGCVTDSDCRPGYSCIDKGLSNTVCALGPENICDNEADDDGDFKTDCEDEDCQGTPACTGGAKAAGQPCATHAECYSVNGDPVCLSEIIFGYPGGYCSEYCQFMNDCGPGALCTNWFVSPSGAGTCMRTCMADAQCRPGYVCLDVGFPQKICVK